MRTTTQYRIQITRVNEAGSLQTTTRLRGTKAGMERLLVLLGPEPWRAYTTKDPDELECCANNGECGCSGLTVREAAMKARENLQPINSITVSKRTVTSGQWEPVS